jgi:DNA segregation ATPase FtsK/SpoIIIE-like protein
LEAGIHLILIYDFARARFISREIKANLPSVIVFRATSSSDSLLVGVKGAEKLTLDEAILKGNISEEQSNGPGL